MAPPAAALLLLCLLLPAALAADLASPPPSNFNQRLGGRPRRPAHIGTSFIQTSLGDLEGDAGGGKTTCQVVVDRSKGYGTKAIAIVLTVEARGYELAGLEQFFYKGACFEGVSAGRRWTPTGEETKKKKIGGNTPKNILNNLLTY